MSRTILPLILLCLCTIVHGQSQWELFGGPQIARVGLNPSVPEGYQDPHESSFMNLDAASGWGMHLGASFRSNPDRTAFKGSLLINLQHYSAAYTNSYGYHGLGGSYSAAWTGTFDDRLTLLELPLQYSIEVHEHFMFDVGLSPWLLIAAERRDHGTLTSRTWTMNGVVSQSTSTYDETRTRISSYHEYGISGDARFTAVIRDHWTLALATSVGFSPIYQDQSPLYGHHLLLRASIVYRLNA